MLNQIIKYFPNITQKQQQQFTQLLPLYTEWNEKINVISRKDIDQLYQRHVLHSLGIAKIIDFEPNTKLLDVGTGGGFPGIPLAILFPQCTFVLVDSIGKKIMVVNEVAATLGLKNVRAYHERAEMVEGKFDFIISRAVTKLTPFYEWVKHKVLKENKNTLPNGILCLKGGNLDEELNEFIKINPKNYIKQYRLKEFFDEDFFETKAIVQVWK